MTPQTIVQIESFYPECLEQVHAAWPGLQTRSFQQQIAHLLATGFSGGHNVVPHLDPARWDAHYIVLNGRVSQQRWAEEHGLPPDTPAGELLLAQLRHLQPQVLYLSDIPGFDFSLLDRLPQRPFVVGWHATTVSPRIPWGAFDLVLSGIQGIRDEVLARGARAAADFMPAAPAHLSLGGAGTRQAGVGFSGSFYGGIHTDRALQFRRLARAIRSPGLDIYTAQPFALEPDDPVRFHPPVYGHEVIRTYARHAIVLDSRGDFNLGDGQRPRDSSNMRIFEATRAGSLLLTENSPNLARHFEPGVEVETYGSLDELVDKIRHYTQPQNEEQRLRIARAGLARVRRSHLIEHRAAWFESLLQQHMGSPARSSTSTSAVADAAAPADALADTPIAHDVLLLRATADSLLFTLAQAEAVLARWPGMACHIACPDDATAARVREAARSIDRIQPRQAQDPGSGGDDLLAILRASRAVARGSPGVQRVLVLGSDIGAEALDVERLGRSPVTLGRFDLGAVQAQADEALGAWTTACLCVTREVLDAGWLGEQLDAAGSDGLTPQAWVNSLRAQALEVQEQPIATPWAARSDAEAGLAHIGPLSLLEQARWQFLPYDAAPGWQNYLQQVYMPLLRRCQQIIVRLPGVAAPFDQHLQPSSSAWRDHFARLNLATRGGYTMLSSAEYRAFAGTAGGWDTPSVAAIQHESFRRLLEAFRAGRPRSDLQALATLMRRIAGPASSVLEEGCGSGYNSELIRLAAGEGLRYTGIDLAHAMIDLARDTYPRDTFQVMASERLDFDDRSFDIVLNGASLMHTVGYEQALREACRVARRHVVLHTVTVADTEAHVHFEKNAYGSRVPEVCFSARGLDRMLQRNGLLPVLMEDSVDYDLGPAIGVPSRSVSLACLRLPEARQVPNHYCTYFDSNYLPRGLLMIRSLLRHDPTAVMHVLCLDEVCAKALAALQLPVRIVPLTELLEADPAFEQARHNRSLVEWYFTATSCLVNHLTSRHPDIRRLVYLDADLYFYASPEVLLDEAGDASVQIIEHRFSPSWSHLVAFGRFNVGWIAFSTTEEGRAVMADYRARCLEWCYDRLEGDRFGDQKYLDKWPQQFPSCCVSQLQGANVAWWNLANAQPRTLGERIFVGSEVLLFFHFQEIKRLEDGRYATKREPGEYGAYYDLAYAPYVAELTRADAEVRPLIDGFRIKDIRYQSW